MVPPCECLEVKNARVQLTCSFKYHSKGKSQRKSDGFAE